MVEETKTHIRNTSCACTNNSCCHGKAWNAHLLSASAWNKSPNTPSACNPPGLSALSLNTRMGPTQAADQTLQIGSWSVEVLDDGDILIFNKHSRRQRLLLRPDGFAFIGSLSKGLVVEKVKKAFFSKL